MKEKQVKIVQRKTEQARKRKEKKQTKLEKLVIRSSNQSIKKCVVSDDEKIRSIKCPKMVFVKIHRIFTTMNSNVQLLNRVITVPN